MRRREGPGEEQRGGMGGSEKERKRVTERGSEGEKRERGNEGARESEGARERRRRIMRRGWAHSLAQNTPMRVAF